MNKKDILKLLGSCPAWKDNPALMEEVRQHLELGFREEELEEHKATISNESDDFVTHKEFRHEIIRLHNIIEQALYLGDEEPMGSLIYTAENTSDTGSNLVQGDLIAT